MAERRATASVATPEPAPRRYWTPLIAERRQRILAEAKKLIGEVGIVGFTLRDLGQRADVSVTTVYNIFGDKESVIAHAMHEFHAGIRLNLPGRGADLAGFCRAIDDTTAVVMANREYALALADLYFSRSLADSLFEVVRGMPLQVFSHWLQAAGRDGLLAGALDEQSAAASFANLEWASVKDWGAGRIADEAFAATRRRSFLIMVAAVAVDSLAATAHGLLARGTG